MSNKEILRQYAALARHQVSQAAAEGAERIRQRSINHNRERYGCDCDLAKCYKTCPRYLTYAEPEELFRWWGATSPPDVRVKDYIQHIPAPPAKKGGSKSGRKRKNKKISDWRMWVHQ